MSISERNAICYGTFAKMIFIGSGAFLFALANKSACDPMYTDGN